MEHITPEWIARARGFAEACVMGSEDRWMDKMGGLLRRSLKEIERLQGEGKGESASMMALNAEHERVRELDAREMIVKLETQLHNEEHFKKAITTDAEYYGHWLALVPKPGSMEGEGVATQGHVHNFEAFWKKALEGLVEKDRLKERIKQTVSDLRLAATSLDRG